MQPELTMLSRPNRIAHEVLRRQALVDVACKDWAPTSLRAKLWLAVPLLLAGVAAALPWSRWLDHADWPAFFLLYPVFVGGFLALAGWGIAWSAMHRVQAIAAILERNGYLDRFVQEPAATGSPGSENDISGKTDGARV